jgi:replicative DNA helicase
MPDPNQGLPIAVDAERSCLGAILLDNDIYFRTEKLAVTDFALDSHRKIYSAIIEMAEEGTPVDMITLSTHLGDRKHLDNIGGVAYLSELTEGLPRRDNIDHYVRIVREKARLRKLIRFCHEVEKSASANVSLAVILETAQSTLLEMAAEGVTASRGKKLSETLAEVYARIDEQRKVEKTKIAVGWTTGIPELDEMTTGFHPNEVTVVGGWTGEGKTSYLIQVIIENLLQDVAVGMFSLEMKEHDIVCRVITAITRIMPLHLRDPRLLTMFELSELEAARAELQKYPFYIDDTGGLTIDEVTNRARVWARKNDCKIHVVDYLKLIRVPSAAKTVERLSTTSQSLLRFAKDEKRHVIAASQLSVPEGKKKRRPGVFDIKESGDVANDAHNIFMFYRPETDSGVYTGFDELIIEKQRAGPKGLIKVIYDRERLRWRFRKEQHKDE